MKNLDLTLSQDVTENKSIPIEEQYKQWRIDEARFFIRDMNKKMEEKLT